MDSIAQLSQQFFMLKMGFGHHQFSVDWALERLRFDQEGNDLNIVLLAAATTREEALPLIEAVLETRQGGMSIDDCFAAGKYVASLHTDYLERRETIETLGEKFSKLFNRLNYPDWLVMLSRNCEYATDIPEFKEPFEQEFEYIATLWGAATSRADFDAKYSRETSNRHDIKLG